MKVIASYWQSAVCRIWLTNRVNLLSLDVPRVSYFLGISIYMYWRDHAPAHFHAIYNDYAGEVVIETGELLVDKEFLNIKGLE